VLVAEASLRPTQRTLSAWRHLGRPVSGPPRPTATSCPLAAATDVRARIVTQARGVAFCQRSPEQGCRSRCTGAVATITISSIPQVALWNSRSWNRPGVLGVPTTPRGADLNHGVHAGKLALHPGWKSSETRRTRRPTRATWAGSSRPSTVLGPRTESARRTHQSKADGSCTAPP
jgi:hypothetical protein